MVDLWNARSGCFNTGFSEDYLGEESGTMGRWKLQKQNAAARERESRLTAGQPWGRTFEEKPSIWLGAICKQSWERRSMTDGTYPLRSGYRHSQEPSCVKTAEGKGSGQVTDCNCNMVKKSWNTHRGEVLVSLHQDAYGSRKSHVSHVTSLNPQKHVQF